MDDNTEMPFGKHKGEKLANVPGKYLLWLESEIRKKGKMHWSLTEKLLIEYIEDNKDVLQKEL